jgi:hypothetical protein
MDKLIGVGLYTPSEAGRLIAVSATKIVRWLRGHRIGERQYTRLWTSPIDLGDGRVYLDFRDLMEVRVADGFITRGISPQRIRAAILMAGEITGEVRPLSTDQFRTDGRDIFLRVVERDERGAEREKLLNLFRRQYEFKQVIEPLLRTVEFDTHGAPSQWWPRGRRGNIVVDPSRAFGQPIDAVTSVPTAILAAAGHQPDLGIGGAARAYDVPEASIRRAMEFEARMERRAAA